MTDVRIGVDIGGTFTDVVAVHDGGTVVMKVPSTPDMPERAVIEGVKKAIDSIGADPADVDSFMHATTVGTNALLESNGGKVGLVTTGGFGDTLEIARLRRPDPYDLGGGRPSPLVPRDLVWEVEERLDPNGEVIRALPPEAVDEISSQLGESGVESVAISFLHSFRNPDHERALADGLKELDGEIQVFVSHEIAPEAREYERTSTTVIAAYLAPIVSRYVQSLKSGLIDLGLPDSFWMMKSNGGLVTFDYAADHPEQLVESGPAAGVLAAAAAARDLELDDVISFDMGGTTAKAALVSQGEPALNMDYEVGGQVHAGGFLSRGTGYPLRSPVIDLAEVGTGGGSVAWVDGGGGLRLGPMSSGAMPGPACYRRGGEAATTTDADLILGYIGEDDFGEDGRLDRDLALAALDQKVGGILGLDTADAAESVFRLATTQMADAVRLISVTHGHDPRDFTLVAFGGSGPVHAWAIAQELGIGRVVVPGLAGVNSAVGLMEAGFRADASRGTRLSPADEGATEEIVAAFEAMRTELFENVSAQGIDAESITTAGSIDVRYRGQSYELNVEIDLEDLASGPSSFLTGVESRFHEAHHATYGHSDPSSPVELVVLRMSVHSMPDVAGVGAGIHDSKPRASRTMIFDGTSYEAPIVSRGEVDGTPIEGPVAIRQHDTTTIVPPGAAVFAEPSGYLIIELKGSHA